MKSNKPRSREKHTKRAAADAVKIVKVPVPLAVYDQFRTMERNRQLTKEEVFEAGLRAYLSR